MTELVLTPTRRISPSPGAPQSSYRLAEVHGRGVQPCDFGRSRVCPRHHLLPLCPTTLLLSSRQTPRTSEIGDTRHQWTSRTHQSQGSGAAGGPTKLRYYTSYYSVMGRHTIGPSLSRIQRNRIAGDYSRDIF